MQYWNSLSETDWYITAGTGAVTPASKKEDSHSDLNSGEVRTAWNQEYIIVPRVSNSNNTHRGHSRESNVTSMRWNWRNMTLIWPFCVRSLHHHDHEPKRTAAAASDSASPQAKRPAALSPDSFLFALSSAGEKEYSEWLNFWVGHTVTKGS